MTVKFVAGKIKMHEKCTKILVIKKKNTNFFLYILLQIIQIFKVKFVTCTVTNIKKFLLKIIYWSF